MTTPIYIPASGPDDWKQFLKDPDKHWKTGYSARALAYCWHDAEGLPAEIRQLMATATLPALRSVAPLLIIPEHITPVAGRGEPPHSDVFVLARTESHDIVSMTIEGKVSEPFGDRNQTVGTWLQAGDATNRRHRLDFLLDKLALPEEQARTVPYQLVQRTASAVVEAERFGARFAVMIVQSFSPIQSHYAAFRTFVNAFGKDADPGQLVEVSRYKDIPILVGWAQGHERYLTM